MNFKISDDGKELIIDKVTYKAISDFENEFSFKANKILHKKVLTQDFINAISNAKEDSRELIVNFGDNIIGLLSLIYLSKDEILTENSYSEKRDLFESLPLKAINKMMGVLNDFFTSMAK